MKNKKLWAAPTDLIAIFNLTEKLPATFVKI
jgi:hypothetical protein